MDAGRKTGIALLIIGICIPLFALPFVSGFDKDKGFLYNFRNVGIRLTEEAAVEVPRSVDGNTPVQASKRYSFLQRMKIDRIPLRFFFIPTVILAYIGIAMIARAGSRARSDLQA